jgi:8-oxo-dGTP pyrophosphatase MutT (NUDIX family)
MIQFRVVCEAIFDGMIALKIEQVEAGLRDRVPRKITPRPGALVTAVAMILREHENEAEVLLIKRADRAGDPWSGQVALPGGRKAGNENLIETAIREAREEVGIDLLTDGRVLGQLDDVRGQTDAVVTPFVAELCGTVVVYPNDEVASYSWVPLKKLQRYEYVRIPLPNGVSVRRRAYQIDGLLIWGITYRILSGAIRLATKAGSLE